MGRPCRSSAGGTPALRPNSQQCSQQYSSNNEPAPPARLVVNSRYFEEPLGVKTKGDFMTRFLAGHD